MPDNTLQNAYNTDTPGNTISLMLFVIAHVLIQEGYNVKHTQLLLERIRIIVADVANKSLVITEKGIVPNEKDRVIH